MKRQEESRRQVAERNGDRKRGGGSGCAVTAIIAGVSLAGAIGTLRGWA